MQPFLVRLKPGAVLESMSHPGEEFLYCIEGQPTVIADGKEYQLSPGDTLYLPSHVEHTYSNAADPALIVGGVRRQEAGDREAAPRSHEAVRRSEATPPGADLAP